jgi:hypothetical protein
VPASDLRTGVDQPAEITTQAVLVKNVVGLDPSAERNLAPRAIDGAAITGLWQRSEICTNFSFFRRLHVKYQQQSDFHDYAEASP